MYQYFLATVASLLLPGIALAQLSPGDIFVSEPTVGSPAHDGTVINSAGGGDFKALRTPFSAIEV